MIPLLGSLPLNTRILRIIPAGFLLTLIVGSPSLEARAATSVTLTLEKKAEFWTAHGRDDLATQTYRQLLFLDPNNRPALIGLASDALRQKNRRLATKYINVLRTMNPMDPVLPGFSRESQLGPAWDREIAQAKKDDARHLYSRALTHYQKAFGPYPPPPQYAVEYYNDLSRTPEGYREAVRQLRSLVSTYPDSLHYRLSLGKILSYNPKSRWDALDILKPMALEPSPVSDTATASWRQVIVWEGTLSRNIPEIRSYLEVHPHDRALEEQLRLAERLALSAGPESRLAYQSLEEGQFKKAVSRFRALIGRDSGNPAYWLGLSYSYLGLKQFGKARIALEQARRHPLSRAQTAEVRDLSSQTSFWILMEKARAAEEKGELEIADQVYGQANRIRPDQPVLLVARGRLAARMNHDSEAMDFYRRALSLSPEETQAWAGLLTLYERSGEEAKAQSTLDSLSSSLRTRLEENPDFLVTEGSVFAHTGHPAEARAAFEKALVLTPARPPDTELSWAWTMLKAGSHRPLGLLLDRLDQTSGLSAHETLELRNLHHLRALREEQDLLSKNLPDRALKLMKIHAARHPADRFYREQEATILESQGKNAQAYRLVRSLGPGSTVSSFEASAGVAMATGHTLQAEVWIEEATSRWPESVRIAVLKARLDQAEGHPGKARKTLEKALSRHPRDPRILLALAENDRILGRYDESKRDIEAALSSLRLLPQSGGAPLDPSLLRIQARKALEAIEKEKKRQSRGHLELMAGETAFTQYTQYYYAQVGDILPLTGLGQYTIGSGQSASPLLHLFLMGNAFTFEYHPTPTTSSFLSQSYEGLTPAIGIRFPTSFGYWEGDAGVAVAQHFQTLTPPGTVTGLFLQTDLLWNVLGGGLDFFANFTGYIDYVYFQMRYLTPVWEGESRRFRLDLGPEFITQGNSTYDAFQGGIALRLWLAPLHSSLLFDGGLLNSSAFPGIGGYEGVSWYFLY